MLPECPGLLVELDGGRSVAPVPGQPSKVEECLGLRLDVARRPGGIE